MHHTLLHVDNQSTVSSSSNPVTSNSAVKLDSSCLLMTCRVLFTSHNGSAVEAGCLLDNASSASFISEHIAQALCLPCSFQSVSVSGIEGISNCITNRPVSQVTASPVSGIGRKFSITAIVVPKVTCDLPVRPVPFELSWNHLSNISLSDNAFGQPGRIDALLGIDVFIDCLLEGRLIVPPGSPTAFETAFGWVLGGLINSKACSHTVSSDVTVSCLNNSIRKFWEIEEAPSDRLALMLEESTVMKHFQENHYHTPEGTFVVPLPKRSPVDPIGESRSQAVRRFLSLERSLSSKEGTFVVPLPKRSPVDPIGESRSQAVRRFLSLEHSLSSKGRFNEVDKVMLEYLELGHAEEVPLQDLDKHESKVFYLPMHVVYKGSSSTTKVRAVFDASAKSASGVSLNDMWHSRRKSTFRRRNTKMSYLYHVVALTLLYLLVLVALQSMLLFPSYKGKRVDR